MTRRIILLMCLIIFTGIVTQPANAQLSATLGGGVLLPQSSNLKGNIYSTYDYPLSKSGYTIAGKVRFSLPLLPLSVIGRLSYDALTDNATLPVTTTGGIVNSKFTNSMSVIGLGAGVECLFFPTPVVKPYIGLGASVNIIGGTAKYDNGIIPEAKMNSANRFGLDLSLGTMIDIPLFPLSLELEGRYRMANIVGKAFDSQGYSFPGFGGIPQTKSYNLNDDKNPNDANDHTRAVNYITIGLGVNFKIL